MAQVDRINGLVGSIAVKAPCKVATTEAITLSGAQTIDGIALTADASPRQRVLVKDQDSDIDNGVYDVNSGAWTRSPDFDGERDVVNGTQVLVNEGTAPYARSYYVSVTYPLIIGTDSITFVASSYTIGVFDVSNTAYGASWEDANTTAPSKNSLWDKIEAMDLTASSKMSDLSDDTTPTLGGALDASDYEIGKALFKDSAEKTQILGAITGATEIDLESGNVVTCTIGADLTFTITNPPATGKTGILILEVTDGAAHTITWGSGEFVWDGGTAPTLQTSGVDILIFITRDAGTTWRAKRCWQVT